MPRGYKDKTLNFQHMAVKVKSVSALYQKLNVTGSTICVPIFMPVSQSVHKTQFLTYAAPLCYTAESFRHLHNAF